MFSQTIKLLCVQTLLLLQIAGGAGHSWHCSSPDCLLSGSSDSFSLPTALCHHDETWQDREECEDCHEHEHLQHETCSTKTAHHESFGCMLESLHSSETVIRAACDCRACLVNSHHHCVGFFAIHQESARVRHEEWQGFDGVGIADPTFPVPREFSVELDDHPFVALGGSCVSLYIGLRRLRI